MPTPALIASLLLAGATAPEHPPIPTDRVRENALAFDGTDDTVTVPACEAMRYPGTGGWTVEFWVKPVIYPFRAETAIIGQESVGVPAHDPWSVRAHPTHFEFRVDGPRGDTGRVLFDLALGVWQHVACVYRGPGTEGGMSMSVFVDGRLVSEQAVTVRMESREDPVYFGALTGTYFRGLIDDARVWARALNPEGVAGAMGGDVDPDDPGLRAWWSFDEASGPVAIDRSKRGTHAVLGRPHDPNDTTRPARVGRVPPG